MRSATKVAPFWVISAAPEARRCCLGQGLDGAQSRLASAKVPADVASRLEAGLERAARDDVFRGTVLFGRKADFTEHRFEDARVQPPQPEHSAELRTKHHADIEALSTPVVKADCNPFPQRPD